ncbi:hypothetical protein F4810DRAFT_661920 [Camillea tinctor]|nr:hypothetical protein F4810DRAFT_661920 [Camillea tinctor]
MPPPSTPPPQATPSSSPQLPEPSSTNNNSNNPLFTCTFCWHVSSGPPRVLGRRSARLACDRCYTALLDLAVC